MSKLLWSGGTLLAGTLLMMAAAGAARAGDTGGGNAVRIAGNERAEVWETTAGRLVLAPDEQALERLGVAVVTTEPTAGAQEVPFLDSVFAVSGAAGVFVASVDGGLRAFVGGGIQTTGELRMRGRGLEWVTIGDLHLTRTDPSKGGDWIVYDMRYSGAEVFRVVSLGMADLDRVKATLRWRNVDVAFTESFAVRLGLDAYGGAAVARLHIDTGLEPVDLAPEGDLWGIPAGGPGGDAQGVIGPDVIVGNVAGDITRWGRVGDITAYSVSTTSCNQGDEPLLWIASTNQHPVIAQHLYREEDGRFEQIGMSWLKHGFFALSENFCFPDCIPTDGSRLGIHCSDPYSSSLNGSTSRLGPRFEVNASTGVFPYPFTSPPIPPTIGRRLQVHNADIDPNLNPNARYFVEGMYVTADDAAAGNKDNNASHREVFFSGTDPTFFMNTRAQFPTVQMEPAINAWRNIDPGVTIRRISPSGPTPDGTFYVAFDATDNLDGTWHYEYAIYNMNSHRSCGRFRVPVGHGVTVSNVGFHDVDYHSGEPFPGTDWSVTVGDGYVEWATDDYTVDPDANALRWGSLYNFRFDADGPPLVQQSTLGLFRPKVDPNDPDNLQVNVTSPGTDCNTNGVEDSQESIVLVLSSLATTVPQGQKLFYDVELTNQEPTAQTGDIWLDVVKPNGDPFAGNPIKIKNGKTVPGGAVITKTGVKLRIPAGTPPGDYELFVRWGTFPAQKYCARLGFTVVAP